MRSPTEPRFQPSGGSLTRSRTSSVQRARNDHVRRAEAPVPFLDSARQQAESVGGVGLLRDLAVPAAMVPHAGYVISVSSQEKVGVSTQLARWSALPAR